jgi:hypothetical protein
LRAYEFTRELFPFPLYNAMLMRPDLAKHDFVHAVKTMPDVAAALSAIAFTILGMLLALFGLIGNKPTTVSCDTLPRK